jgi:hypothetical protein
LQHREPSTTSRALPAGRGFLRVIDGGKGKSADPPVPPKPVEPVRYATPHVENYDDHWQQMDLFLWKDQEERMDHFGDQNDE